MGPGGRRNGGRICCIIWCSIKKWRGTGPRGVITIGGLPGGIPRAGCKPAIGGGGGGGNAGLSCGRGVGIFIDDDDEEDEDEEEHTVPVSDGDPEVDPEGPATVVAPPGEGALRLRSSFRGALQDSGVRSCIPDALSDFVSLVGRGGLHKPPGSAA